LEATKQLILFKFYLAPLAMGKQGKIVVSRRFIRFHYDYVYHPNAYTRYLT